MALSRETGVVWHLCAYTRLCKCKISVMFQEGWTGSHVAPVAGSGCQVINLPLGEPICMRIFAYVFEGGVALATRSEMLKKLLARLALDRI
jgi:hypothetical protein